MRSLFLTQKEILNTVPAYDEHILFALERRYFDFLDLTRLELAFNPAQTSYVFQRDLRMMQVTEVNYEGTPDVGLHLMNFQNILASMRDESHNIVAVINSVGERITLNYGLSRRMGDQYSGSTHDYACMLKQSFAGNFMGATAKDLSADEIQNNIIVPMYTNSDVLAFPGIPSLRSVSVPYAQGINRFIEAMRGEQYTLLVIAEPISTPDVDGMIRNLFSLSSAVHANVKATMQKMKGSSDTVNVGMFGMKGVSEGTAETDSDTKMGLGGVISGASGGIGAIVGGAIGTLIPIPGVGTMIGASLGAGIGGALGGIAGSALAYLSGEPLNTAHSFTRSLGSSQGGGGFGGYARSWNRSTAVSQEVLNKSAEYCERLCDTYITRLQRGKNLGFWNVGVYLLTENTYTQIRGHGLLRACLSGEETHWEPIRVIKLNSDALSHYLINFNNPRYNLLTYGEEQRQFAKAVEMGSKINAYATKLGKSVKEFIKEFGGENITKLSAATLEEIRRCPSNVPQERIDQAWKELEEANLGHPLGPALGGISTPMNTEELSIILNVPRQEVLGVSIREAAPFGVHYDVALEDDAVHLGYLVHKRVVNENMPFALNRNSLQKHMFICGVTGSGKTNTCFALLQNLNLPFMVIEPAKSEYRQLLHTMPDLQIYTLGNEVVAPFRLNPLEFPQGGHLIGHIDNLKAVFNAAFPMYASMPYILEEAIIEVYTDKGWDLATSQNIYLTSNTDEKFHDYLPTLQELYEKIEKVVAQKQYAQEQTMNIGAALKARLASLLTGSKGLMLNTKLSTPLKGLLEGKVVLELKYVGDDDEKCFLMGLILSQIYEYRDVEGAGGSPLRHVILFEEAHRLLKRVPEYVSSEVGNTRGKAVETFSNVISEIRDYGEGIVVVDQIPAKLTQDVIKNTNIKIIHRTLALDDRAMVGGTIGLNPAQSNELPLLSVGQAVVHSEGADKPFLVAMTQRKTQNEKRINDKAISDTMSKVIDFSSAIFRRYPGFEKKKGIAEIYRRMDFKPFDVLSYRAVIGCVILALSEGTQIPHLKKAADHLLQKSYRPRDTMETDCRIIAAANRFFERLGNSFPRTVDCQHRAHQLFIDIWFDTEQATSLLVDFAKAMASITEPELPLRYMMRVVMEQSSVSGETVRRAVKNGFPLSSDVLTLIDRELLCILSPFFAGLPPGAKTKEALTQYIFENNPLRDTLLEKQRAAYGEKE